MRIALVTDGIWPYVIGGMQKHSYFLCKYLAKNQVHVLLVHTNQQPALNIHALSEFTEKERKYIEPVVLEQPESASFPGHYIYKSYQYSRKAFDAIKHKLSDVDVIIAKGLTGLYFVNHKENLPPIAINIHGYEFLQKQAGFKSVLESLLLRWPLTILNTKADYVFSYGGKITTLITSLGVARSKILEIPAGIEQDWSVNEVSFIKGKRKLLFLGRYERRKGIEELHAILPELVSKYDFEFHFAGPIPEHKRLNLKGVFYHGMINGKTQLQSLLQSAHVLVCPSYSEGMPNVILEAMANGCAIIASDVGAVNTFVDSNVGWIVQAGSKRQLADAIKASIKLEARKLDIMRMHAIETIKNEYLWDSIVVKLISSLNGIISPK
ncbi:MAG TPA: glycosyltransferase family 4 protein [Flavitalea sp.]|nr:glycosyltransferase family 4 protein [Flavitalea sp.]